MEMQTLRITLVGGGGKQQTGSPLPLCAQGDPDLGAGNTGFDSLCIFRGLCQRPSFWLRDVWPSGIPHQKQLSRRCFLQLHPLPEPVRQTSGLM